MCSPAGACPLTRGRRAGAPPRSPSSLSRSNTPRGRSPLQGLAEGAGELPGGAQRSASADLAAPTRALPVPQRAGSRGFEGSRQGMGMGYAGARGGGSAPGYARTPPSVAGSPALSSLDRRALLRPQRSCRSALLAVPALCSTCGVILPYPTLPYQGGACRVSELAEEGRAGPSRSRSWADAAPEAPERPRPRRARAGSAANPRPGAGRAAPGRWAVAPAGRRTRWCRRASGSSC